MAQQQVSPTPTAKPDVEQRMRAHVQTLNERYEDVKRDDSDEGRRERASIGAQLMRLKHDQIHPGEELVELDVPTAVTGDPFAINDTTYHGRVVVPACVAQQLLWMIDQNRKVDLDRMREAGRTMNLGILGERARAIGRDD